MRKRISTKMKVVLALKIIKIKAAQVEEEEAEKKF